MADVLDEIDPGDVVAVDDADDVEDYIAVYNYLDNSSDSFDVLDNVDYNWLMMISVQEVHW